MFFALDNGIYKSREDGSAQELLYLFDERINGNDCLNIIDNNLYFADFSQTDNNIQLYKMNIDSGEVESVCEKPTVGVFWNYGKTIYFSNEYKLNVENTETTQIYDKEAASGNTVNIVDETIYYFDTCRGDNGIYKMTLDGENITEIYDGRADYMIVDGGWIYFQNTGESNSLYKMKTDGSEVQLLVEGDVRNINTFGDWIYCNIKIDDVKGIYKIKKDATEVKLLVEGGTNGILIIDDWLYYSLGSDNSERLRRVKLDGTDNQVFAERIAEDTIEAEDNDTMTEEMIYEALLEGDYSYFAGTYMACGVYNDWYGGGEDINNLILKEDGTITGGGMSFSPDIYPNEKPISVTRQEDGAYRCQVTYEDDKKQNYFLIYPEGVIGENPYVYNDPFLTETIYIQYMQLDGGVMDIIYYKIDE